MRELIILDVLENVSLVQANEAYFFNLLTFSPMFAKIALEVFGLMETGIIAVFMKVIFAGYALI